MSITDKELLTFCNLANLEMEYANITYKVTEGQDEVERNHTIYTKILK